MTTNNRFFLNILRGIGKKGSKRAGLFFSWFAVITSIIASTWSWQLVKGSMRASLAWLDISIVFLIVVILWGFAIGFWVIVLVLGFGCRISGPTEDDFLLGRWRFLRIAYDSWVTVPTDAIPDRRMLEPAWSGIALDTKSAALVMEAALWGLLARKRLQLRLRRETYHWSVPLFPRSGPSERLEFYLQPVDVTPPIAGEWEGKILKAASQLFKEDALIEVFELIRSAFGDSVSHPENAVLKGVNQEEMKVSGFANTDAQAGPGYEWIRQYIAAHDKVSPGFTGNLRSMISEAIRDRTDTG